MKLIWFILLLPFVSLAQVNSVEIQEIPGVRFSSSLRAPTFNEYSKRLAFLKTDEKSSAIMISNLSASGNWSEPYIAFVVSKKVYWEGFSFNSNGNQLYFDWNSDLYFMDYLGGTTWSTPSKIGNPISEESGEYQPSVMNNDNEIFFLRSVFDNKAGGFVKKVFQSKKGFNWSKPKMLPYSAVDFDAGEYFNLTVMPSGKSVILSTSVAPTAHNYLGQLQDSVITNFREINFSGGAIRWISEDFSYGFGMSYTNPAKIIKINFDSKWFLNNQVASQETPAQRNLVEADSKIAVVKPTGKYIALLIGVSQYQDSKLNLDKPVRDAQQLADVLTNQYSFEKEDINMLSNPTRQEIIGALYKLRSVITPNDNLLIFFAGHGSWDESIKQGYWWPTDAQVNNPSFWLSNSDLREQLRGINSAHTLLISDACFSGGIFKTRDASDVTKASLDIQVLYKTKSRRAITSGNLSTVPDRSIFFEYLTNKLLTNEDKFMPAQKLFYGLKTAVINNSLNIPQEGVITEAGDEGGDFIFIKRVQP